jgi:hypothetical protein
MEKNEIKIFARDYFRNGTPGSRYSSFDYCYNYFHNCPDLTKDMERSCLALGFFLASWGMFRGKALMEKGLKHYQSTIEYIATLPKETWDIDVNNYPDNYDNLIHIYRKIKERIVPGSTPLVLTTKVMLGVFGFVPAFDSYFRETFKYKSNWDLGFTSFNKASLEFIFKFYYENMEEIEELHEEFYTTDFLTSEKTELHYPRAKIIDMYGWQLEKLMKD